jgi:hypothetical protein
VGPSAGGWNYYKSFRQFTEIGLGSAQLQSGDSYGTLRPTYAIWLFGEALLPEVPGYAHAFPMRDEQGRVFLNHGCIWLLELSKFHVDRVEVERLKKLLEGRPKQEPS